MQKLKFLGRTAQYMFCGSAPLLLFGAAAHCPTFCVVVEFFFVEKFDKLRLSAHLLLPMTTPDHQNALTAKLKTRCPSQERQRRNTVATATEWRTG